MLNKEQNNYLMLFKQHLIKDSMLISTPPTALTAGFGQGLGFHVQQRSVCVLTNTQEFCLMENSLVG